MEKFNPQDHLAKHGWKEGAGLGLKEDGIKEAVKVKLKFDQTGVGHDRAEEFTYHWWDHVFNKAANNIVIDNSDSGDKAVKVTSAGDSYEIQAKKSAPTTDERKSLLYGMFVKSSTLDKGVEVKEPPSRSRSSSPELDIGTASKLTDEQLRKVCGGRTAHKGARHGLGLSGKLARIAEQEQMYTDNSRPVTPDMSDATRNEDSGIKKKKKKKNKKERRSSEEPEEEKSSDRKRKALETVEVAEETDSRKKSKNSKKKQRERKDDEDEVLEEEAEENTVPEIDNEDSSCDSDKKSKKKKKKKKRKRSSSN